MTTGNTAPSETALTTYRLQPPDATTLAGAVLHSAEIRRLILRRFVADRGEEALIALFAEFIGLANSVVSNNRAMIELFLVTEAGFDPFKAETINLPTLSGALAGVPLAGSVDPSRACASCAFRQGTPANQSPITTADADWCLGNTDTVFHCHEDLDDAGQPGRLCVGYAHAHHRQTSLSPEGDRS